MTLKKLIGMQIKKYRKLRNLTQEELAEMVDIDPRHLSRLENGKNYPGLVTLEKISGALDVEVKVLFDYQEDDEKNKAHDMINIASNEQLTMINKVVRAIILPVSIK